MKLFFETKRYEDYLEYCDDPDIWEKTIFRQTLCKIFDCSVEECRQIHQEFFETYTLPMAEQACKNLHYEDLKRLGVDKLQAPEYFQLFIESILGYVSYFDDESVRKGTFKAKPKEELVEEIGDEEKFLMQGCKKEEEDNSDLMNFPGLDRDESREYIKGLNKAFEHWIEFYILDLSRVKELSRAKMLLAGYEAFILFYLINFSVSPISFKEKEYFFSLGGFYCGLLGLIQDKNRSKKRLFKFTTKTNTNTSITDPHYSIHEQFGFENSESDNLLSSSISVHHFLEHVEEPVLTQRLELAVFSKLSHLLFNQQEDVKTKDPEERKVFLKKLENWINDLDRNHRDKFQNAINSFKTDADKKEEELGTGRQGCIGPALESGKSYMWGKNSFAKPLLEISKTQSSEFDNNLLDDLFAVRLISTKSKPKEEYLSFSEINNIYHILNAQGQSLISPIFESVQKNIQPEYDPLAQKIIAALSANQDKAPSPTN